MPPAPAIDASMQDLLGAMIDRLITDHLPPNLFQKASGSSRRESVWDLALEVSHLRLPFIGLLPLVICPSDD